MEWMASSDCVEERLDRWRWGRGRPGSPPARSSRHMIRLRGSVEASTVSCLPHMQTGENYSETRYATETTRTAHRDD
jgi:hypothetical protein